MDSEVATCSSKTEFDTTQGASTSTSSTGHMPTTGNPEVLLPVLQDIDLLPVKMPSTTYSDGHTHSLKKEWFVTYPWHKLKEDGKTCHCVVCKK